MSGAFSKALRVVALLCVLLGVSNTAFGAYVISVYKNDGSGAKNTEFVATGNGTQQKATFGLLFCVAQACFCIFSAPPRISI